MRWYRKYSADRHDHRLWAMPAVLYRQHDMIVALAGEQHLCGGVRGMLPPVEAVAFALRLPVNKAAKVLADLEALGLLERDGDGNLWPERWNERQFASDDANARSKKHRARNVAGNSDATLHATAPETDADTDAEQTQNTPPSCPPEGAREAFEEYWSLWPYGNKAHAREAFMWAVTDTSRGEPPTPDCLVAQMRQQHRWLAGLGTAENGLFTADLWLYWGAHRLTDQILRYEAEAA